MEISSCNVTTLFDISNKIVTTRNFHMGIQGCYKVKNIMDLQVFYLVATLLHVVENTLLHVVENTL